MAYTKEQLIEYLYRVADAYGIDRDIAYRQIDQESDFDPNRCSGKQACGIAQFIPDTARRFGLRVDNQIDERFDPIKSLDAYGAYMSFLLERFGYRYDLALAGYNSGEFRDEYTNAYNENRGINWSVLPGGVQTETRAYVRIILGNPDQPYYVSGDIPAQDDSIGIHTYESSDRSDSDKSKELLTILAFGGLGILLFVLIAGGASSRR